MSRAKLFSHGGSQALRLPKEYRFEGSEVHVRRAGQDVVLSPCPPTGITALIDALGAFEPGVKLLRESPQADVRAEIAPRP